MLTINWIKSNTKPAYIKVTNILTRFFLSSSQTTFAGTKDYYFKLENTFFLLTNNK